MQTKISNKKQISLIILCWAIYTLAYLGRYSYVSNGVPIQKFYNVGKDEFSLATTFFFFAYGACQIIFGLFCGKFNMRIMLPLALLVSSLINISVFFGLPFRFIKYLWLLNGICQSILWPSLMRIISCYCDEKNTKFAVIAMSTTVAIGTLIAFGSSALFALFDGFKYSFLLAAVCMTSIAVVTLLFYGNITENARLENLATEKPEAETLKGERKRSGIDRGLILVFLVFGIYAVGINLIKDGLTTWVPQILSDNYNFPDSLAIALPIILPIFGIFGALCAVSLNKKVKDYSDLTGLFFVFSAISVFGIILLLKTEHWYFVLTIFGLVNMFMHGANNAVTSMLPLSLGKKYNAGLVAGVLNGLCYVGSTISQYGIAAIATATDWSTVMRVLLYLCVLAVIVAAAIHIFKVKR